MLQEAGEAAIALHKHVVIVIDGVDDLSSVNRPHSLDWLPTVMPCGVRIVISLATGNTKTLEALGECWRRTLRTHHGRHKCATACTCLFVANTERRDPALPLFTIGDLVESERSNIAKARLAKFSKALSPQDVRASVPCLVGRACDAVAHGLSFRSACSSRSSDPGRRCTSPHAARSFDCRRSTAYLVKVSPT